MSANVLPLPVQMVRCSEDCDSGRIECPECNGCREVGVRVRPARYHSMDPGEACDYFTCERCEAEGSIECTVCGGRGEYPYEEWMGKGLTQKLPEVL